MVEFTEIQFAYYTLAATGVLVAAIYYIISLRYNMKAREMEICRLHTSDYLSDQGTQKTINFITTTREYAVIDSWIRGLSTTS